MSPIFLTLDVPNPVVMFKKIYSILLIAFLAINTNSEAQIVINEYSCANVTNYADNFSKYEDWFELFNSGTSPVNIGGYYLSDKLNQPTKWMIPTGTTLNANARMVFYASGRNITTGTLHTNFRISQTKIPSETIVFSDNTGTIIDFVTVARTKQNHSNARIPDGSNVWKICASPTPNASNIAGNTFIRYSSTPTFNLLPGFYTGTQQIQLTTTEPNSIIRFTLDGTEPIISSSPYIGPISITAVTVIKAATFSNDPNIATGFVNFGTYFINVNHTIPVVSVAANQLTNLANGNGNLVPFGSIEYFDINKVRKTTGYGEFNRHGQDSWANDQRSIDFVMYDELGYNYALQNQIFSLTHRDEFQRVILRAAGDDNYPAAHHTSNAGSAHLRDAYVHNLAKAGNLNLDVRVGTKAIVYMNGEYWGVYDLREIPDDHDFTNYYYGQDKFNLQYIETWGGTWAEYGGNQALTDWNNFHNYVMANDMTDPAIWDNVTSQLDVNSLADYIIVNSVTVCSDWLNYNTGWWRGLDSSGTHKKWGYILWDNDATFGFYINYTGIPDTSAYAPVCNVEPGVGSLSDPEQHLDLLMKLRENPTYDHFYKSRYIDLMNTIFSCDYMLRTLDSTVAVIDPEMTEHAARWTGTYAGWRANVARLRSFIERRCQAMPAGLNSCYSLSGPYPLTLDAYPIGTGTVTINSLTVTEFPWTGNYYNGIDINLQANPDIFNDFSFDSWETTQGSTILPALTSPLVQMNITGSDSVIAHFIQHTVSIPVLEQNKFTAQVYPTITNGITNIEFYLPQIEDIQIKINSISGRSIWSTTKHNLNPGQYSMQINLTEMNISPGIYMVTINSKNQSATYKLIIQ